MTAPAVNPFKYGGKELNTHLPQPFYDFVARMQLPQLCLFQRPDPKASDYTWLNPFTYCAGNPINLADPNGETKIQQMPLVQNIFPQSPKFNFRNSKFQFSL